MEFSSRIKKEMTEGIVRAILEDAGYRVIDSGIEKVLRELSCLSSVEYLSLGYPDAMSHLPDFTVMDREQKEKTLVEVKYRSSWDLNLFEEVREQVRLFGELTLVSVNSNAPSPNGQSSPSRYLRCCRLKFEDGRYKVELRKKPAKVALYEWRDVEDISPEGDWLWWAMSPLQERFKQISTETDGRTLFTAIEALAGIVNQ